jgi:hypothetical protein
MSSDAEVQFVLKTILDQKKDSPLSMAFQNAGVFDVGNITSLTDRAIDRLKYQDTAFSPPINEELGLGYQQLIRVFSAFIETKNDEGDPIHLDLQNKCTKAEFDEYRLVGFAKYVGVHQGPAPTSVLPKALAGCTFPAKVRDPVLEFKKGIKRDLASFTVMKENKQWDSVHRTLKSQTSYQDVADVIDPSYVLQTVEDIALFEEKQKYMYSVLDIHVFYLFIIHG